MKADVGQQRSLLELTELDAELTRLAHRISHLTEREEYQRVQQSHTAASDRLASVRIALEDVEDQAARFESEIDAVRQREDRDRALLRSGDNPKQLTDLQHELETLQRRQASLEDSLLEVLEQREQLQARQAAETAVLHGLAVDLANAQQAMETSLAGAETTRAERSARRGELAAEVGGDLLALYERQRAAGGAGAGVLRGGQCGACRIEIDRGELGRISAAAADDVLRCPECGAILLRSEGLGR